jgi:tripartite-type tricarboxylate transporter receptor subunit TctC
MKDRLSMIVLVAILVLPLSTVSLAADFPTKPITLVNPMSPGGSHDVVGRAFASAAEKFLGQPVVVVNKPGASGMIGMLSVVQAPPDGYTLIVDASSAATALEWEIANGRTPPFTRNDFIPVGSLTMSPALIVVPYNSPWKTLGELIKDCKAKPGHYAICSGGLYGASHLPAELLTKATGIKVRHVPYKGGGPCLASLVGAHEDFATQYPTSSIPLVRGNKLRVLAVQGSQRLKSIPGVPTVKELGVDAEYYFWLGVAAPKKTPGPILQKLKDLLKKVAEDESFIKIIENQGDEVRYMGSDELMKYCDKESAMHAKLYKQLLLEEKK